MFQVLKAVRLSILEAFELLTPRNAPEMKVGKSVSSSRTLGLFENQ